MTISVSMQAELATVTDAPGLNAVTVVALPPSDLDPSASQMRVYIGGILTVRDYDPTMVQP